MPSTLIDANGVSRSFGARVLFEGVELQVHEGDRIALVGRNGSGKSTLLRILAGEEVGDEGTVVRHGSVAYLPQLVATPELTARAAILERIGVAAATRELDRRTADLAGGDLEAIEAHAAALDRWLALGGEDADARLSAASAELGLPAALLDRALSSLSGGQASRAGLTAVRIARCDVVLLDEPTNHLDRDRLARLRTLIEEQDGAIVLVSHERALLTDFADTIVELDGGNATRYAGGWETSSVSGRRAARGRPASTGKPSPSATASPRSTERSDGGRRRALVASTRVAPRRRQALA